MAAFRRIVFFLFLMNLSTTLNAQSLRHYSNNVNAWFMYFGDHKFASKWGVHLEAQIRRADGVSQWQQLLLRTGINYHLNQQIFVTAGYCFVQSYPYGDFPVKAAFAEHRLWEQLQIKNQYQRFEWVSRLRIEQRFSNLPVLQAGSGLYAPGDAVYTNRFRLLNRISMPFIGKTIKDNSVYWSGYDEVFINAGKNVGSNLFDQNRLYMAIGYKLSGIGRLEAGYLHQLVIKSDGVKIENNHTWQLGLSSTTDFMRRKK